MHTTPLILLFTIVTLIVCMLTSLYAGGHTLYHRRRRFAFFNPYQIHADYEYTRSREHLGDGPGRARQSRIVVATICRDVEAVRLLRNMYMLNGLLHNCFADYRVVIFENDSTNGTREMLRYWCGNNPRCKLIDCEGDGDAECRLNLKPAISDVYGKSNHTRRVAKLARYRQKVFDHIKEHYTDFDYMLVIDLDLYCSTSIRGFLSCFRSDFGRWGSMATYGADAGDGSVHHRPSIIYDPYSVWLNTPDALPNRKVAQSMRTQLDEDRHTVKEIHARWVETRGALRGNKPLIPVRSAFNGLCLYDLRLVIQSNCSYVDKPPTADGECEHVTFARGLVDRGIPSYINSNWVTHVFGH